MTALARVSFCTPEIDDSAPPDPWVSVAVDDTVEYVNDKPAAITWLCGAASLGNKNRQMLRAENPYTFETQPGVTTGPYV